MGISGAPSRQVVEPLNRIHCPGSLTRRWLHLCMGTKMQDTLGHPLGDPCPSAVPLIPVKGSVEISFLPPPPLQLLRDDEFRHRLRRLRALLAVMLRPHPLAHLRQQLLPKRLFAQTPTALNRLELLAFHRPAPFFYLSISRTEPFTTDPFTDPFSFRGHSGSEGFWPTETVGSTIVNSIVFSILKKSFRNASRCIQKIDLTAFLQSYHLF